MTTQSRRFHLQRDRDVSGVSGTGVVALGVLWPDQTASVRWLGDRPSIVFWDDMADAVAVHGHGGATRIVWTDEECADREETSLRDRITEALLTTRRTGYEGAARHGEHRYDARCALCAADVDALADTVLAVLPEPAAVLDECDAIDADYRDQHDGVAVGARAAVMRIRARAVLPAGANRAAVLGEAADAVAEYTGNPSDASAKMLRRRADGAARPSDPQPPTEGSAS